ncbi:MAG: antitoxin [Candidatus Margulisbacteria bacterium]|jgi:predicted DNA binding CopG/RHH family protein|nr:antitoxin [Candidatus Margulisiibacteriota bacterium]
MRKVKFLDQEEKKLISSLENDGWRPVEDLSSWQTKLAKAATNTLTKDQRMNIRVTRGDLDGIKLRAAEEGLPYQTLISSIIHKYLTGRLVDNRFDSNQRTQFRSRPQHA